jgi:hypothetical protein
MSTPTPPPFPSYTSYNAKTLLQHVDTLKQIVNELRTELDALKVSCCAKPVKEVQKPATKSEVI